MIKAKIMIVEDEALLAVDLKNHLEKLNYKITAIASSSEKALKRIDEDPPDLVLMDIKLKGDMDGIDTAQQIKTRYNIPVLYLTAHLDSEYLARAKLTEPFGYLVKPVEPRELHATIEMALYKARIEKEREKLISELQDALSEVKTLRGLLPICAWCKKIRDDKGYWNQIEVYISKHSEVNFSHGICPECYEKIEKEYL